MKRKIVLVGRSVVCVLLVGCTVLSVYLLRTARRSGGYSDVCSRISSEAQEWILAEFGDCPTFEELLRQLDIFAIEHFEYGDVPLVLGLFQMFDLDNFLFGEQRYRGVCFDFSCWVKCCVIVWSESHKIPVKAFVLDVKGKNYAHSYNVFYYNDATYTLDVTTDHTRAKKGNGLKPIGPIFNGYGNVSMEQIAAYYNETITIIR